MIDTQLPPPVDNGQARVGEILDGRYRLDGVIAQGGFATVYHATHLVSCRTVAIKLLHPILARHEVIVERFRREAATLSRLRDPHTVQCYELANDAGVPFLVMELLTGETLHDLLQARGPLGWQRVAAIARGVCNSLIEAHELGIVHRDLKPHNIMLENDTCVRVLDFGVAKGLEGNELTMQGEMIGTYAYMAPEQIMGSPCTPASDIYALGIVMYELLCGERPFGEVKGVIGMLDAVVAQEPPPIGARVAVPADLAAIVMRCLAREPAARFRDARELAAAIDALPQSARRFARGSYSTMYQYDLAEQRAHDIATRRAIWLVMLVFAGLAAIIATHL